MVGGNRCLKSTEDNMTYDEIISRGDVHDKEVGLNNARSKALSKVDDQVEDFIGVSPLLLHGAYDIADDGVDILQQLGVDLGWQDVEAIEDFSHGGNLESGPVGAWKSNHGIGQDCDLGIDRKTSYDAY
ncbi:hypothetical protein ACLOJK_011972 [Asimina triloba]